MEAVPSGAAFVYARPVTEITFPGAFRPGAPTVPQPTPDWYLKFLSAEERETAVLMGFFSQARIELETFIREGDLTVSDARFYRDLLAETNRIASKVNEQGARWISEVIPDAYMAGRLLTSSVVVNERALRSLANDPLRLITDTSDMMRRRVRQAVATGILEGLSGSELRNRIIQTGLTNIPRWPSIEYRAGVIARTETMRAFNAGNLAGITDTGARFVRWIASPDEATCSICLPRDGVVFRISGEPGENDPYPAAQPYPGAPAHPRCRCTIRAEYRDAEGNVIRDSPVAPPPTEVDPKLSTNTMGADDPPVLPPAAGDLRKAVAKLDLNEIRQLRLDAKRNVLNPGTGLDDPVMVQIRDAARKRLDELHAFWRHVDLDEQGLRIIAGMEGGTVKAAIRQTAAFFELRYGIVLNDGAAWSKGVLLSSLKSLELIRSRVPRYVVDSPKLQFWGSAPATARRMSGSRAAEMYASCHMRPNFTALKKYVDQVDGYNLGVEDTVYTVLVHELGHAVHNRYGLHQRNGFNADEFGDDLYVRIEQKNAFDDDWKRLTSGTGGRVAPNERAAAGLDELKARLAAWEERSSAAGYAGAYKGVIDSLRKQIESTERLAREGPVGEYHPTDYARKGGYAEDFAESFMLFLLNPERLKKWSPGRYEFMLSRIFPE